MQLKKYFLYLVFSLAGSSLLMACSESDKKAKRDKARNVEVITVDRQPVKVTRIITGSLEAIQKVQIFNEEPGKIKQIHFYEGDKVEQDALLIELDGSLIQAQLDKARASLNQAKLDLKRLKRLVPSNLASEDQLARAKTAVDQTQAEVRLLETRFNNTRIRAPFAGVVSTRHKDPGDVVPLHSHILDLVNPHSLKATMNISGLLLPHLQKDALVQLRIDALGDTLFPARILRVHPVVDPVSRQGVMEVLLDPVPVGAVPGQLCRLYLSTETGPLRTIPLAALRHDAQGEYVYRVDAQNQSRHTRVKTGLQLNTRVEILEGLEAGNKVVTKGIIGLRDGSKVKIARATSTEVQPAAVDSPAQQKGP
ncbi:MAG: efflux RND transporter periplasmic adaptor subunit [Gammaproteobacteria bacterium]|nr:efflux RND transporter periplasmic adaptor subunit [Gammaproteobacteria bacterium]